MDDAEGVGAKRNLNSAAQVLADELRRENRELHRQLDALAGKLARAERAAEEAERRAAGLVMEIGLAAEGVHRSATGDRWPLVGREDELARIARHVRRSTGGLLIAGPSGVGRSRVGAAALALAEANGAAVVQVAGTHALSSIPLGIFASLLPSTSPNGTESGAELLRGCREALNEMGRDRRLVLLVDDAHLVDEVSAGLLHQLVDAPLIYVIATVDTDHEPTAATVLLSEHDAVDRIDLEGLDIRSIDTLLVSVLGGPVDPAATRALAAAAQGSLVYLRELVRSAMDEGTLQDDVGVWRLLGPLPSSKRLTELVQVRLEGLSDDERQLLEVVAVGEPLTVGEVAQLDLATLEELERRGLVRVSVDGRRTEVRTAHAIFGQVVRAQMPILRARAVTRQLADAIEATGMRRRDDLLRVATWRLDSGGSQPELMLSAAKVASSRSAFDLAERLARLAVDIGAGFDAALLVAQVTGQQGRREEAEELLVSLSLATTSDRERALVAAARLDNSVFTMGHVERGLAIALDAEATLSDPMWRMELAAKRSSVLGGVEGPSAALAVALPVVQRADGRAFVWASLIASWALGRMGRPDFARDVAIRGRVVYSGLEEPLDWRVGRLVFFEADALVQLGQIDDAVLLTEKTYREAVNDGALEDQAWFAWQLSRFAVDRGRARTAATFGRLAVALFRQLGAAQYEQLALADLAATLAIDGRGVEAQEALAFLDALELRHSNYFSVNVLQARGWTSAANGDLPAAIEQFRQGTTLGVEIGDLVGAASCAHGIARLGAAGEALAALEDLATRVEPSALLVIARRDHVRALVAADADPLESVAARFDAFGATLLAAEAAADAAVCWRDDGSPRRASAALRTASQLAVRCEQPTTPALSELRRAARLTPAERTVAVLAANGRTSRQIAEELVVSVRTVENHLQRAYEKLGIRGRSELKDVVGVSDV